MHFSNLFPIVRVFSFIWSSISEANSTQKGVMHNNVQDLSLLRVLRVKHFPPKAPKIAPVFLSFPSSGLVKINIDGAAAGAPSLATGCGIFWNSRGFVRGFFFRGAFAFVAELGIALYAIDLAWQFTWTKLWIESDSSYVVSIFSSNQVVVSWKFKAHFCNCIHFNRMIEFQISHIYQEGNKVADNLSKRAY